jgi:nitrogen-specific signal transduction histidine kinase/CheY-like chemotaxis protein
MTPMVIASVVLALVAAVAIAGWLASRRALKQAAAELAAVKAELARKDSELAHKEKLATVGQLVSGVAHELNNPLQGVLGYAELMLAERPAAGQEELRAIRDSADKAAGIVRSLLTVTRREPSTRSWQQLNRIVQGVADQGKGQLEAQDVNLTLRLADRLPLVYVDRSRIEDVVGKLIRNAEGAIAERRAGRGDGGAVPRRAPGAIHLSTRLEADPDRIVLEVADNGSSQGSSLGLSVVHGIVHQHGGRVTSRSGEAGGTVVTVELPVAPEAGASLAEATPAGPGVAAALEAAAAGPIGPHPTEAPERVPTLVARRKALVVDDEESNAALLRRALDASGYDVESTTLARRALVMIERTPYDCVIADVRMPELSGQELYTRVCMLRPEMARRFIFITGDIEGEDTRQFLEQSRCSYFMKPFNLARLTAAVDALCGTRPAETIG